ncbi:MAG TPA: type II secretion system F family protein [Tepidisphaeraceae bacterium]|jgi:tight adherence protein C|nr:type II secretion system F family protein [Tepidisphaeraceae bacterium]
MDPQLIFIICIFGAISAVVYWVSRSFMGRPDDKLRSRLSDAASEADKEKRSVRDGVVPILQKIGQAAAEPFMPKTREKQSSMRRNLGFAGIYSPVAMKVMTGFKLIFLCVGVGIGYAVGAYCENNFLGLSLGGLIGYLGPTVWLRTRIKNNQKSLTLGLPDALDLMVVCVEAGLTVDSAMQRVGQELGLAHPALSRELGIAHMETRVGLSRPEAMKNLGVRTGSPALQSLAAMLIQADRFGTSIASALRIHAESLRHSRQAAAEELAAKASVKMSFPLVLFIFPATFIVLAGPTVIQLMNSDFMK